MSFRRRAIPSVPGRGTRKVSQILGGLTPAESASFTLDGTGSQLTLTGGTATFRLSLTATGSQATLTGGTATLSYTSNWSLAGTGTQLTLAGGTAAFAHSLTATGGSLTLAGGSASLGLSLLGTGSALTLTGGEASFSLTGALSLTGTGSALTLTGGTAAGALGLTATGGALALTGGQAAFSLTLGGTGAALTLTGGTAGFALGGNVALVGTGSALTLTGGEATFTLTEIEPEAPDQPSGGYAAENWAALERARRRRLKREEREAEDEALADRLERQLAAEGLVPPPAEAVEARIVVREYGADAAALAALNRRAQRAVAYAERARTDLAYLLAARAIARQIEEEELALLLILAAA